MENKKRGWRGKNPIHCPEDLPAHVCKILREADGRKKPAVAIPYLDTHEGTVHVVNHKAFRDLKHKVPSHIAKKLKPVTFDN